MEQEKLDFVAIGDTVTDAFIELQDAWIEEDNPEHQQELCMRFGDKIPYRDVVVVPAVGNSPNASVAAHRLGLKSAIVTNVGDDAFGMEDIETFKNEGVITDYIKVHPGQKSNYHYILRYKAERTILIKHWEYPYELPEFKTLPQWIYLSSLGENSLPFHHRIGEYLAQNPTVRLAFQPGTFQIKLGYETLRDIYTHTHIFFCNKEEAQRILGTKEDSLVELLKSMHQRGPKIVVITDGPKGAYAYDGTSGFKMPMYPDPAPPVDRTGAGDSFSSTFTCAIALGESLETALSWGPINSMSVVQYIGAQAGLLTKEKLLEYLASAPDYYKPERII